VTASEATELAKAIQGLADSCSAISGLSFDSLTGLVGTLSTSLGEESAILGVI
jgi:hypothetical protein